MTHTAFKQKTSSRRSSWSWSQSKEKKEKKNNSGCRTTTVTQLEGKRTELEEKYCVLCTLVSLNSRSDLLEDKADLLARLSGENIYWSKTKKKSMQVKLTWILNAGFFFDNPSLWVCILSLHLPRETVWSVQSHFFNIPSSRLQHHTVYHTAQRYNCSSVVRKSSWQSFL